MTMTTFIIAWLIILVLAYCLFFPMFEVSARNDESRRREGRFG